jgi:hypothetical protein
LWIITSALVGELIHVTNNLNIHPAEVLACLSFCHFYALLSGRPLDFDPAPDPGLYVARGF